MEKGARQLTTERYSLLPEKSEDDKNNRNQLLSPPLCQALCSKSWDLWSLRLFLVSRQVRVPTLVGTWRKGISEMLPNQLVEGWTLPINFSPTQMFCFVLFFPTMPRMPLALLYSGGLGAGGRAEIQSDQILPSWSWSVQEGVNGEDSFSIQSDPKVPL